MPLNFLEEALKYLCSQLKMGNSLWLVGSS